MNILWITKFTDDTYHKTTEFEMSEELINRGHNVKIVMAKNIGENKSDNKKIIYIPTLNYPFLSGLIFGLFTIFYLPLFSWKQKIDIIIIDEATVWLPFTFTLRLWRFPLILDIRTLPIDRERAILFDIALFISKYFVDGLTTITPELEKILREKYNLKNKEICIWASGVSIKKFTNVKIINENVKSLRDSKLFILMYHGAYSTTRGIENLIKSLKTLDDDIKKNILLLIIGFSPEQKRKLTLLIEANAVHNQVKLLPKVDYNEISSYISICDVGIYPLPPDNLWWQVSAPLKTLEYLAMSKPIIVTNIPFHKRIFEKGECGVLLETNSSKDIANAITYLYQNKEKLASMGKNGREIVEKFYKWEIEAKKLEKFLQTVIKS